MKEKTIKLSEIKKLSVKPGDVLLVRQLNADYDVLDRLSNELGCMVVLVDNMDDFKVISMNKIEIKGNDKLIIPVKLKK